jgi:hypothetical protein
MSRLICPLCGFNRPLSTFTPYEYELDLKIRQVHGLGQGKGFEHEDYSILGDEHYSPIVADRCLDLIKMFMEVGTLSALDVFLKLQVPVHAYQLYAPEYSKLRRELELEQYRVRSLEQEMEEKKEKVEKNMLVSDFLIKIHNSGFCDTKLSISSSGIQMGIITYEKEFLDLLLEIYVKCSKDEWFLFRKRLTTERQGLALNLEILDEKKRKEKDVIDKMLEIKLKPPFKFFPLS